MNLGAVSAFKLSQVQSQVGIRVLKSNLNAQATTANALLNGFNRVESTIASAAKEPGNGQQGKIYV